MRKSSAASRSSLPPKCDRESSTKTVIAPMQLDPGTEWSQTDWLKTNPPTPSKRLARTSDDCDSVARSPLGAKHQRPRNEVPRSYGWMVGQQYRARDAEQLRVQVLANTTPSLKRFDGKRDPENCGRDEGGIQVIVMLGERGENHTRQGESQA